MITILGAGGVGMATALILALREVDDLVLIRRSEGVPQGEALDLSHALVQLGIDLEVKGSNDYADMAGSDIVLVTAGQPRKPGMTREELLGMNASIVASLAEKISEHAPKSVVILTTNPVDPMTYVMYKRLGFPRERVIGFSGALDTARLAYYASKKLGVSPLSINPVVLGMHGEAMYPVPRLSSVGGVPLTELLSEGEIEEVVRETVRAGAVITKLRGYSSTYGPAAGLAAMAESVKRGSNRVFISSVYLEGEYGVKDVVAEVPVVIGRRGAEKILELPLNDEETRGFMESVEAVRKLIKSLPPEYT